MIVRILGESQRDVAAPALDELNELDAALADACSDGEHEAFASALTAMLDRVRELGTPLDPGHHGPSDLVLPPADASLAEVSALLSEEGLIPG
jgi:PspAA-like protein